MKVAAVLLVLLMGSPVYADKFEESLQSATMVPDSNALAALFWSADPKCDKLENSLHRSQCIEVSSKRRQEVSGKTFFVEGTSAVSVQKAGKKAVKISVYSAFSNGHDESWVVGPGVVVKGDGIKGDGVPKTLYKSVNKKFKDEQYLAHWSQYIAPRLKTEFLVQIPSNVKSFKAKGKSGFQLEVVGYRLFDPCSGDVLSAKPAAKRAPQDSSTCEDEPKFVRRISKPKSNGPQLPGQLSRKQIGDTLKALKDRGVVCRGAYGINGRGAFKFTIGKNGVIKESNQTGDFVGTPTGICLEDVLKTMRFPEFRDKDMKVSYPVVLRE